MFRLLDLAIVRLHSYVEENYIYNVIQVITNTNPFYARLLPHVQHTQRG